MGVEYSAVIMVGLPRGDFWIEDFDLDEALYDGELETCAPYYDGDEDPEAIIGFAYSNSGAYSNTELEYNNLEIEALQLEFLALTKQEANVYLCTCAY